MNFNLATDFERTKHTELDLETQIEQVQRDIDTIVKMNRGDIEVRVNTVMHKTFQFREYNLF